MSTGVYRRRTDPILHREYKQTTQGAVTGNDAACLYINGSHTDVLATLATLKVTPTTDYTGEASLIVVVKDAVGLQNISNISLTISDTLNITASSYLGRRRRRHDR